MKEGLLLLIFLLFHLPVWNQSTCDCTPLNPPTGTIEEVNNSNELNQALSQANTSNGHMTIVLNANTYLLNTNLLFISENMINLTIRGATGNRDDVVIKGLGWNNNAVTHIFNVAASGFTLADVTIGEVYYHPVQLHNSADHSLIQNVRFIDAKEQLLKVSSGDDFNENGKVLCCEFEFTAGEAYQYYTGGIDAHRSRDWEVKYNVFKSIRSPDGTLSEHAIHFWRESSGTYIEGNHIIECDRGIGFGLGSEITSGHTGGIIMNNFVHTNTDVGIGLESAPNTKVYNNTVVTENYDNSIEYRFSTTSEVHIVNNLVNGSITSRDGGTGNIASNATISDLSIFADANNFDYHLIASTPGVTDVGMDLTEVALDYDCSDRSISAPIDIGADEFMTFTHTDVALFDHGIGIYPNPTEDIFTIVAHDTSIFDQFAVDVLDSQGQVHQSYQHLSGKVEIDISDLPPGLYFIRIERDETLSVQLILKGM